MCSPESDLFEDSFEDLADRKACEWDLFALWEVEEPSELTKGPVLGVCEPGVDIGHNEGLLVRLLLQFAKYIARDRRLPRTRLPIEKEIGRFRAVQDGSEHFGHRFGLSVSEGESFRDVVWTQSVPVNEKHLPLLSPPENF